MSFYGEYRAFEGMTTDDDAGVPFFFCNRNPPQVLRKHLGKGSWSLGTLLSPLVIQA